MIYFDYNATTPLDPAVRDAMVHSLDTHHGNPSSSHRLGRQVRAAIDQARQQLADLLGADPNEIIFTSGGSEANNQALKGVAFHKSQGHLIISAVEHPAVCQPARWLADHGFELTVVPVDRAGRVNPDDVRRALTPQTILISIMLANNEVGTLQPLTEIAAIARQAGVLLHTDAAQAIGKIPVNVDDIGVDLLSMAGHKFHAPPGIGALYIRRGSKLDTFIHGAGHEQGRRAGTEAVPAIVGLGVAAQLAMEDLARGGADNIRGLRDRFHIGLSDALGDRVVLNGHPDLRLPNTLNLGFVDKIGPELLARMENLAASSGAACHADRAEPSAVLKAMNVPRKIALGAVRFSLGRFNTAQEVEQAITQVTTAVSA